MGTTTFQINVTRSSPAADHDYVVEIFGITAKSSSLEEAMQHLTRNLFKTRKQLTDLPDAFKTDQAREVLRSLNSFLPKPSHNTSWE